MPDSTGNSTGTFIWHELMTPDAKAAEHFYTAVVGWRAADAGMPGGDYTILSAGDARVAGLMAMPPQAAANGAPPGWRGYISVPDTDAFVGKVTGAGGQLHYGPEDIPGVGRVASVTDPQGAPFLLFAPAPNSENPTPAPGTPGTIGWNELSAADHTKAFDFYAGIFGWTKSTAHNMGPLGIYQLFAINVTDAGGMMNRMDPSSQPRWTYYFVVDAAGAAVDRIKSADGQVTHGPQPVPGGSWIVQAIDPQGVPFAVVAPLE